CDAQLQREIDRAAFAEYVRFQHVLGDKTFFTDIHLLGNASVLTYDARLDRLTAEPYWDPGRLADAPRSLRVIEAAEEAGRLLENAVGRCASGPLRVGVQLSGGVDARAVLG